MDGLGSELSDIMSYIYRPSNLTVQPCTPISVFLPAAVRAGRGKLVGGIVGSNLHRCFIGWEVAVGKALLRHTLGARIAAKKTTNLNIYVSTVQFIRCTFRETPNPDRPGWVDWSISQTDISGVTECLTARSPHVCVCVCVAPWSKGFLS